MSTSTYNIITVILLCGALGSVAFAGIFLIAAIVGWRSPYRNRRLVRFALSLVACPLLVGIQQAILWNVFLPSFGEEHRQQRQARLDAYNVVHVGDQAPEFSIVDTQGESFEFRHQPGKVVLVNFFATWCGPCILELPHLQKLWAKYRDDEHFALVVIGREETTEKVAAFQKKHDFSFPMAADPEKAVYSLYAKGAVPHTYLIGADGKICFEITGYYESELKELELEVARQLQSLR